MENIIGSGAPVLYNHANLVNAQSNPSTVHVNNTGLNRYFAKYLMQDAMSVFEWTLPEHWDKSYFLYVLYTWGFAAIINTDKFGVIPQGCGLRGYNVFYRPTHAVISNPLLKGILEPVIDEQCTVIKLQPDYNGIIDIVDYYANALALCTETMGTNLVNSKLSYVFGADNKTKAESFKKMFDKVASGEPAVFIDKTLFDEAGKPTWFTFAQDLKSNYIVHDVLEDMRKLKMMFDTAIGIPNANTDKKERLITDEVNANNFETQSKCTVWLENLQEGCRKASAMFGLGDTFWVDWRQDLKDMMQTEEPAEKEEDNGKE